MDITDMNNMGAAMAPAAADTIERFLQDTGTAPTDYDLIITGDLGFTGSDLLHGLLQKDGIELSNHNDCGMMIFDRKRQDVHSGGSGCGCSASVLCSYLLKKLGNGELKNILFCATGALMSPTDLYAGRKHTVNSPPAAHKRLSLVGITIINMLSSILTSVRRIVYRFTAGFRRSRR